MPGIEYNIVLPHGSVCLFKRLTVAREFAYMVGGAVLIYVDARRREQKKKIGEVEVCESSRLKSEAVRGESP